VRGPATVVVVSAVAAGGRSLLPVVGGVIAVLVVPEVGLAVVVVVLAVRALWEVAWSLSGRHPAHRRDHPERKDDQSHQASQRPAAVGATGESTHHHEAPAVGKRRNTSSLSMRKRPLPRVRGLRYQSLTAGAPELVDPDLVEDTSSYGVVPTTPDGRVEAFLEMCVSG